MASSLSDALLVVAASNDLHIFDDDDDNIKYMANERKAATERRTDPQCSRKIGLLPTTFYQSQRS